MEEEINFDDEIEAQNEAKRLKLTSIHIDFKQNLNKYESTFNLQRLSLITFAISLWTKDNIKYKLSHYLSDEKNAKNNKWNDIEEDVYEEAMKTLLSNIQKRELEFAISIVGNQIREWLDMLHKYTKSESPNEYVNNITWTKYGTIDKKKTFESLVRNPLIDKGSLYNLACNFCFEDYIQHLWYELPERLQMEYKNNSLKIGFEFIAYWSGLLNNRKSGRIIWIEMYNNAQKNNMDLAVKYSWQKMTQIDRQKILIKCWLKKKKFLFTDSFNFLLTQMNEEQFLVLVENNPIELFKHLIFFNHPKQDYLHSTVIKLLEFIEEDDLYRIMIEIVEKICLNGINGLIYKNILIKLWQNSHVNMQNNFLITQMKKLFSYKGLDVLQIMIKLLNDDFIYDFLMENRATCCQMVITGGDMVLESFLNTVFSCRQFVINFKILLAEYGIQYIRLLLNINRYEMFFKWCLVDDDQIIRFKLEFCNFDYLRIQVNNFCTYKTVDDFEKFLNWCLISENEKNQLRQLKLRNEKMMLENDHHLMYCDYRSLIMLEFRDNICQLTRRFPQIL